MGKKLVSYEMLAGSGELFTAMMSDASVKREVADLLHKCKDETTQLLEERRTAVERIRDELLEREELVGDQLDELMRELAPQLAAREPAPKLKVGQ